MWIINEENHDALCVAENLGKAVMWLVTSDWLTGDTIGIDEDDNEYTVASIVKGSDEDKFLISEYLLKLCHKDGVRAVLEWLEQFGFYIHDIEVA